MIAFANFIEAAADLSAADELELIRQSAKPYGFVPSQTVTPTPVVLSRLPD